MRYLVALFLCIPFLAMAQIQKDSLLGNTTPEYDEIIKYYQQLDEEFPNAKLIEMGSTDVGKPLHLFIISDVAFSSIEELQLSNKVFLLINNGIHPGEPDGINASILFADEILREKSSVFLQNCVVGIVPVYNVDGCLNRGKYSRANQDGPEEYGFRGNARNLDLNRDFIKCDSENAKSFSKLFQAFNPHLLIDTHVSNGADYQYTMTSITSQVEKLNSHLKKLALEIIEPHMYSYMKKNNFELAPYVNTIKEKPDDGIADFLESPRFATGYAALFNVLGFTTETHMLKPFPQRVKSTLVYLNGMKEMISKNSKTIIESRKKADQDLSEQKFFELNYQLDTTNFSFFEFKGYEGMYKPSEVSGSDRLFYDRKKPFTKKVKYYRNYISTDSVSKPYCYIIPQAWREVIERFELNGVEVLSIKSDTIIEAEVYFINGYETGQKPYEGHYLHKNITTEKRKVSVRVYRGDFIVFPNDKKARYVVETLEPKSMDSFFAWNFFDEILQQKEWFSDYVFEDVAAQLLEENSDLKQKFENKKKEDSKFAADSFSQLLFIYNNSKYKEGSHNLYPIYRIEENESPEAIIIKKIIWR